MAVNNNYIKPGEMLGSQIKAAKIGKFIHIILNGKKETVKVSQIALEDNRMYKVVNCDGFVKLYPTSNYGWTCSQEQYDTITREGSKIIENLFGDLLKKPEEE
jgi:hypothetical protein